MDKIDLFIIGTQKAGTTAVKEYLDQCPDLLTHHSVELPCFLSNHSDSNLERCLKTFYKPNLQKDDKAKTIAKNVNMLYDRDALINLYNYNKEIKILVILRNPVERAYSSYLYAKTKGWESSNDFLSVFHNYDPSNYSNVISKRSCRYKEYGVYIKYVKTLYEIFPFDNIKILLYDQIKIDMIYYLKDIRQFLNLNPEFNFDLKIEHNVFRSVRNQKLANLTQPGGFISNFSFLPTFLKSFLKNTIVKVNTNQGHKPHLDKTNEVEISEFYSTHNQLLFEFLGIENIW